MTAGASVRLVWGAASDVGRIRQQNEDSFIADPRLFVVADGMGGHNAGEVASAIAVRTMLDAAGDGFTDHDAFVAAVRAANAAIHDAADGLSEQRGMGTTLTAVAPLRLAAGEPPALSITNVGDSRTYVFRDGELRQLSVDHSYVQELLSEGLVTAEEARVHPRRNIVTRALGIDGSVSPDAWVIPLVVGDRYLLCSDGLVDEVTDADIAAVLRDVTDPNRAASELVAAANRNGGRDNVTVIVVDVQSTDSPTPSPVAAPPASVPHTAADTARSALPRRRGARRISIVAVACTAVLVSVIVGIGVNARRGYFVRFESRSDDARLLIYRGSPESVLWFAPTIEADTTLRRSDLHPGLAGQLDDPRSFESAPRAAAFVNSIRDVVEEHTGQ
jgi:serine/threonine protein phosphatase PrpC